jgi:hypothetical protein
MWSNIIWCTGKDSNLRTSLGGTDLQSVGFNHSPTCAHCRVMQPLCFIQQAILIRACKALGNPQTARQHTSTLLFFCLREPKLKLSLCQSGKTNLRIAAKITTRRNNSEWSALEKPVAPPSTEPDCLPEIRFLRFVFWSWRRDLNP